MAAKKPAPPAGSDVVDEPEAPTPPAPAAPAPGPARYRVVLGSIVFPTRTAHEGDILTLSDADVANMLPLGVIELVTE